MSKPKTVLIVDDEMLVRMVAVEIFIDAGFQVLEAGHSEEALEVLTLRFDDVHLLFTDINMPGAMDGLALAHHVCRTWPRIALLIASGAQRPTEIPAGSHFLPKPYTSGQVMPHVQMLIA